MGQQGNNAGRLKEFENWGEITVSKVERHVGHPAGYRERGVAAILTGKTTLFQAEYSGTQKPRGTLHRVPVEITEDVFPNIKMIQLRKMPQMCAGRSRLFSIPVYIGP